jgi:glucokinase
VLTRLRRQTGRSRTPAALLDLIVSTVAECAQRCGTIDAIGVGFPGLVQHRAGRVVSSVILDGWSNVPLAAVVERATGVPCLVDNDVRNAARAEVGMRGRASFDLMLFVSIGTGIGGALARDGHIVHGAAGFAGEIGHVSVLPEGPWCRCGRRGCVGPAAGGEGIAARLGIGPDELAVAVRRGDPAAHAALAESARLIGHALGSALNLLNADLVVIGGGMADAGSGYLRAIEEATRAECFPGVGAVCRIEPALSGYDAGAIGGALLARELLLHAPS